MRDFMKPVFLLLKDVSFPWHFHFWKALILPLLHFYFVTIKTMKLTLKVHCCKTNQPEGIQYFVALICRAIPLVVRNTVYELSLIIYKVSIIPMCAFPGDYSLAYTSVNPSHSTTQHETSCLLLDTTVLLLSFKMLILYFIQKQGMERKLYINIGLKCDSFL